MAGSLFLLNRRNLFVAIITPIIILKRQFRWVHLILRLIIIRINQESNFLSDVSSVTMRANFFHNQMRKVMANRPKKKKNEAPSLSNSFMGTILARLRADFNINPRIFAPPVIASGLRFIVHSGIAFRDPASVGLSPLILFLREALDRLFRAVVTDENRVACRVHALIIPHPSHNARGKGEKFLP